MTATSPEALVVRVGSLLRRPGDQREEVLDVCLEDLVVLGSRVPDDAPIHLELHLESLNDGVVVSGPVSFTWSGQCRRCLAPLTGTLSPTVQEIFVRDPVEGETRPLAGDELDLEPVVRDAVLLDLPMAPLCRPDCAGLCPECGADANLEPCSCSAPETDPRWAVLDALQLDDGND